MGNDATAIPELLLKGEAVAVYHQNQLDLALCKLRDALASVFSVPRSPALLAGGLLIKPLGGTWETMQPLYQSFCLKEKL